MKVIEKLTSDGDTQIFEILTSKKELKEWLRGTLCDSVYSKYYKDPIFNDPDTTIAYYDKDGSFHWIAEGEKVKRPNISKIAKFIESNSGTTVIYGDVPIIYNEHYGDWEVDFER